MNASTKKLSVIVTTYNRPDVLKRVIQGLLFQTRLPDEIVIADDGSSRETKDLVNGFIHSSKTCRIAHVWQEDKGFRAARIRNLAIKETTGDCIISLDGDCIPEMHFIQDHLTLAKRGFFFQGKRLLVGKKLSRTFAFEDTKRKIGLIRQSLRNEMSNIHHIFRIPFFPALVTTRLSGIKSCNMGFFREDLYSVNGFNQDFTGWGREDSELAVRLYNLGLKRREHPFLAVCFHLWHDENKNDRIEINDTLLKKQMESKIIKCKNGIETGNN